jgi:hypothetical protein
MTKFNHDYNSTEHWQVHAPQMPGARNILLPRITSQPRLGYLRAFAIAIDCARSAHRDLYFPSPFTFISGYFLRWAYVPEQLWLPGRVRSSARSSATTLLCPRRDFPK